MTRDYSYLYFRWLCSFVCNAYYKKNFFFLLSRLHDTPFSYMLEMDANRFEDGVALRYRYGKENDIPEAIIASELDTRPCSVLEMLVGLCIRAEEQIMWDPDIGDRTGWLFWSIMTNLGIHQMDDHVYNDIDVDICLARMLNREYEPNGEGGLFYLKHSPRDLRDVDIWYQMMWYLDEVLGT